MIQSKPKREARWRAHKALLERQKERERNGFYEGQTSVATALAHSGAGRLQRVKKNDTGKRKSNNLTRLC